MFAPDYTPQPTDEQWAKVPLSLIKDTKLTDGAKLLYAYIAAVNAPKSEPPRQAKIAADLEITPSAVTKRVKELVARDWLIVWTVYSKGLRFNAYQTFQSTAECRKYRDEHLGISYVNFNDKLKERKARVGNRKPDGSSSPIIELVQASNQANDGASSSNHHSSSSSISYVFADEYIADNTSISNEIDMRPDQQPQDMVSDDEPTEAQYSAAFDFVMAKYATESTDDKVLDETHEEPPTPVPPPPSPSASAVVMADGQRYQHLVKSTNVKGTPKLWCGISGAQANPVGSTAGFMSKPVCPDCLMAQSAQTVSDDAKNTLAVICYGTAGAWAHNGSKLGQVFKKLGAVSRDELLLFERWWKRYDWRGKDGQRPTTFQLMEFWETAKTANKPAELVYVSDEEIKKAWGW